MQSMGIAFATNSTSWATAFVALAGLTKLPFPGRVREWIDMTALDSADNWEEGEKALLRRGMELEFEYNTSSARMEAIDTLVELATNEYCKITIPGETKFFWFRGAFLEHTPGEGSVGTQKVTGKFKVKTVGKIYFQTAAPT